MNLEHPARKARPRRSMLYVPGSNARALDKARRLPVDSLILDLEGGVLPESKAAARAAVVDALMSGGYGPRELVVRVNHPQSEWIADDLEAVARASNRHAVLIPRVERPEELRVVEERLDALSVPQEVGLMAMVETPLGILSAQSLASATPRLVAFVIGTNDLEAATGARQTVDRIPMLTALSICVLAARAYGVGLVDGIHPKLDDPDGLRASCVQGLELGFDGKTVIHPKQIEIANDVFGPTEAAVAEAKAIVDGFEKARTEGRGVTVVDGRMVELLHVRIAERTLALAEAIETLQADSALSNN